MIMKRIVAWCLLSLALATLGPEVIMALDSGHYYPLTLLDFWKHFAPISFEIVRMISGSPIFYWVWNPVLTTLLKVPGWGLPLAISIYFFMTSRRPARRSLQY